MNGSAGRTGDKTERVARRIQKLDPGERRTTLLIDIAGPKVRLGVIWFIALLAGSAAGRVPLALLFAVVAFVAALQVAAHLMILEDRESRLAAGCGAASITLVAIGGPRLVGVAVLIFVAVAVALASRTIDPEFRWQVAGLTIRSGLFVGLAGASVVLAHRVDTMSYFYLVAAASAYEMGSFLVGSGARNQIQGPLAGIVSVLIVVYGWAAFPFPPLDVTATWVAGVMLAVLLPAGQYFGTMILPRADARAPALRRIDSYLLAGPAYVVLLWVTKGALTLP